jgi:hypothetical protein
MWHVWGTEEVHTEFVGGCDGKVHFEDLGLDGIIILICISKKFDGEAWTGLF